jgi:hypothetical protein
MPARSPLRPRSLTRVDATVLNGSAAQWVVLSARGWRRHVATYGDRIGRAPHGRGRISRYSRRRWRHARVRWNRAGRLTSIGICGGCRHRGCSTFTRTRRSRRRWHGRFARHGPGGRGLGRTVWRTLSNRNASPACAKSQQRGSCEHDRSHRVILSCSSPRSASWRGEEQDR